MASTAFFTSRLLLTSATSGKASPRCCSMRLAVSRADGPLQSITATRAASCNGPSARETASLIEQQRGEALPLVADVSNNRDVKNAVEAIVGRYGRLDLLFACAAAQITKPMADTTEEEWDHVHSVNLKGVFLCCKHVVPVMRKQGGGSIAIASSGHAFVTYPNSSAYAGTKGGLLAFMRGVALDYAADGIRVNCIVPGATDTPLLRNYINSCADPQAEERRII